MQFPASPVFVFGSNLLGVHGAGAARWAREHRGARMGQGEGRQGQAYAIPTKATPHQALPLPEVAAGVERFISHAHQHPEEIFEVTPIGCGLAGFNPQQIGPLFNAAPANCWLPVEFTPFVSTRPMAYRIETRRGVPGASESEVFEDHLSITALGPHLTALVATARAKGWRTLCVDPSARTALLTKPSQPPSFGDHDPRPVTALVDRHAR